VQIVMDMDGWGTKAKKIGTYSRVIYPEPVQFTGIKLFYKNDLKPPSTGMLTTSEVLSLTPAPIYYSVSIEKRSPPKAGLFCIFV